jgi:hypothetical protein
MPSHNHTATSNVTDPGHAHNEQAVASGSVGANFSVTGNNLNAGASSGTSIATGSATTGISVATTVNSSGSGGAHNNVPLSAPGTFYRKL